MMKPVFYFLILLLQVSCPLFAQEQPQKAIMGMDYVYKKWTGDLDGMVKRRLIRVLVAYNKTNYFLDKDTQRGIAYDAMTYVSNIYKYYIAYKLSLEEMKERNDTKEQIKKSGGL